MTFVYINGEYLAPEDAKISILDRGFRFGDGVFETISFYNKNIYQLDKHIERLNNSLAVTQINYDTDGVEHICTILMDKNKLDEGIIRLTVSRGEGNRGYLPSGNEKPTIVAEAFPLPS